MQEADDYKAPAPAVIISDYFALLLVLVILGGIVFFAVGGLDSEFAPIALVGGGIAVLVLIYRILNVCNSLAVQAKANADQLQQMDKKLNILNKRLKELNENQ